MQTPQRPAHSWLKSSVADKSVALLLQGHLFMSPSSLIFETFFKTAGVVNIPVSISYSQNIGLRDTKSP